MMRHFTKKTKNRSKPEWIFDAVVLVAMPLFASWFSLWARTSMIFSTFLFFGLPAIYLSIKTPHAILRTLVFSLIMALPVNLVIDYLAHAMNAWFVPTVYPFRFLGLVPIEDFVYTFLFIYAVTIFYEHFLDRSNHNILDKRMKYLIAGLLILVVVFAALYLNGVDFSKSPLPFSVLGLIFLLTPLVLFLTHFVRFISKYVKVAVYFVALQLLNEITALKLGYWTFPGSNYVGWVQTAGVKFPLEELFFFIIIGAVAILTYFEYFDDSQHTKG